MQIHPNNIHSFEFPDLTGLGLFHFKSEYLIKNLDGSEQLVSGFGTSDNREIAAQKSLFELFERIAFFYACRSRSVKSSNGFAAHFDFAQAKLNAYLEVIERDVFFDFWFNRRSPRWISDETHDVENLLFQSLKSFCRSMNFEIQIGIGLDSDDVFVLFGIVSDIERRFGGFINTTASLSINGGINSVVYTLSRYITIVMNRINHKLPIYKKMPVPKIPSDHFEYYLITENFDRIRWLFKPGHSLEWSHKYNKIKIEKINQEILFPISCEIAYAYSDELQGYFAGPTLPEKLNKLYINNLNNLNMEIHPLP